MSSNGKDKENDDDIEEGITSPLLRRPIAIQSSSTTHNDTNNTQSSSIQHQTADVSSDHQIATTHTESTTTSNNNTNTEGSNCSSNGIEYIEDEQDDGPTNDMIRFVEEDTINSADIATKLRLANKLRNTTTSNNTTTNIEDMNNDDNAYAQNSINQSINSTSEAYDIDSSNSATCGDRASNIVYSMSDYDESIADERISSSANNIIIDTPTTALIAATTNDTTALIVNDNNTMDADVNVATAFRTTEAYLVQSQVYDAIVTKPWYKQRRVQVTVCILVLIVAALSIAFGIITSKRSNETSINPCFETFGELNLAVDQYINEQNCISDDKCQAGKTYGWPMNTWCVGNITDMSFLFARMTTFNENIGSWDVSNVQDMDHMFAGATSFDGNLNAWNTSSVTNMANVFSHARSFSGDLSDWDVSNVTTMNSMFDRAINFNSDISQWTTSSVTKMNDMFRGAVKFNADISNWNTSRVETMREMFENARSFNIDISNWSISSCSNMNDMFYNATAYNQNLCKWGRGDSFPYDRAGGIFLKTGCTYTDLPREKKGGPFCASNCSS